MPLLTDYLSRRNEFIVLAVVVILSIVLMLISSRHGDDMARAVGDAIFTPVHVAIDQGGNLTGLSVENDSLRARLARATLEIGELRQRDAEGRRLRELLDFRDASTWTLIPARIVGRDAARAALEYKIDRGRADGVDTLAVIAPEGLVGRISRVSEHSAWIRPIVAPGCRVSARVERTRTEALVAWSRETGTHLEFVPFRAEVTAGDVVVSSGLGGVFPGGLKIGEVTRTEPVPAEGTLRVFVSTAVDFSSLESVFVVRKADGPPLPPVEGIDRPASPSSAPPSTSPPGGAVRGTPPVTGG